MNGIDPLREKALKHSKNGLTDYEIAKDLNVSKETVKWLLVNGPGDSAKPDGDVKIGWRSVGARPSRIALISELMVDVMCEEAEKKNLDIDAIVGVAINGLPYATFIAEMLDLDLAVFRPHENAGAFCSNYAHIDGKDVVLIDDVLGSGDTLHHAIKATSAEGGRVVLCICLLNKTDKDDIDGVPVRGLIRARPI